MTKLIDRKTGEVTEYQWYEIALITLQFLSYISPGRYYLSSLTDHQLITEAKQ